MMQRRNRLDKAFGPSGTFAGVVIFIAGCIMLYQAWSAVILILIGAFVGFSSTGTVIDIIQKRVKFTNYIFGFIPFGSWITITPDMRVAIKTSKQTWRSFSQSNRTTDIEQLDYRIMLYDAEANEIVALMKAFNQEKATELLEEVQKELGISQVP